MRKWTGKEIKVRYRGQNIQEEQQRDSLWRDTDDGWSPGAEAGSLDSQRRESEALDAMTLPLFQLSVRKLLDFGSAHSTANKGSKQDRGGQEIQGTRNAHRRRAENAAAAWRAGTPTWRGEVLRRMWSRNRGTSRPLERLIIGRYEEHYSVSDKPEDYWLSENQK